MQEPLERRDADLHIVITGRGALLALTEYADTVPEMSMVRHAHEAGIGVQAGTEH